MGDSINNRRLAKFSTVNLWEGNDALCNDNAVASLTPDIPFVSVVDWLNIELRFYNHRYLATTDTLDLSCT